jgi:hypothetical protein
VKNLAAKFNPRFVVPLGIKKWLADRGITNAVELNWGQSVKIGGLTVVCTPAQHGSGRTLTDQGRRLWASWAVLGSKRFYFAGDTGYYEHFKEIGDALGPFDPRGAADRLLHASRPLGARPHLARRSAPGLGRPARGEVPRNSLGDLRAGARAVRRAAPTDRRGSRAPSARSPQCVDCEARRHYGLVNALARRGPARADFER